MGAFVGEKNFDPHVMFQSDLVSLCLTGNTEEYLQYTATCPQFVRKISLYLDLQQIRNTWKVLKCGAGEGWRRSVGPIM